jgi:hypothetical protein
VVLQRCIPTEQGRKLLEDIHHGASGDHAVPRTLIGNAFEQGFYWLTAVADATHIVRTYEGCQYDMGQTHLPSPSSLNNLHHVAIRGLGA